MKQLWQTDDGQLFETQAEAKAHEAFQFEQWLAEMPVMDLNHVIQTMDDVDKDQWYGTEKDIGLYVAQHAYSLFKQDPDLVQFARRHAAPVDE